MKMNAKQRSAADHFAEKVNSINELLNDPSSASQQDLKKWDAVVDDLTTLAEVDYANCNTDAQKIAVIAVLTAALDLRTRLRGTSSKPLSDLNNLLINGALGKPTLLHLPTKVSGSIKPVNDVQSEVYYVVLYKQFPTEKNELNVAARKSLGLTKEQLRRKRYDLLRQRAYDLQLDRMFKLAEVDVLATKSYNLKDYI